MNTIEEQEGHHERLFLRVRLCGTFHLEWVHPLTAEVVPVADVVAGERDRAAALSLLALLLAQPNRHAYRDWIMEQFWPDQVRSTASHRLENVFSTLRKLLRPPSGGESLLHSIRGSRAKGILYGLDAYPHLWADVDALVWNAEQAARMERFGDDALPLWARAFALLKPGPYLPDEFYAECAKEQRERLDGYYRQCVHALWRLYTARQGEASKAEALLLLRTYWQQHKTDEDTLHPLLELLGEQERYQEAEEYYQQLLFALAELGPDEHEQSREPDSRTRDIREYLCAKQIQRKQVEHSSSSSVINRLANTVDSIASTILLSHPEDFFDPEPHVSLPPSHRQPSFPHIWNVPYQRNPFFTGREDVLTRLHEMLNRENAVIAIAQQALYGLGGIGKTQTVLEYTYLYGCEYQAVFWIKADTNENVSSDFLSIATLLSLPEKNAQDQAVTTAAVKQWLREHTGWLLVFDNVNDLETIREILPTGCQGHVLLTTRAQSTGGLAHHIEIEGMSKEIGALFLLRRSGIISRDLSLEETTEINRTLARDIVMELGGLPLALAQAGAYIEETSSSLQEYIQLYQKWRYELLKRSGGLTADHPEPVTTTWLLSFQRIEQCDQLAADLLRLFAFLDPDMIPEDIVRVYVARSIDFSHEGEDGWDQFRVNVAFEVLLRFSLVQRHSKTRTVTIHRLVQAAIRDSMDRQEQHMWIEKVALIVRHTFPHTSTMYGTSGYPYYAVQLLRVSIYKDQASGKKENLVADHWKLAVQQQVIGRLKASEQSLLDGLSLCSEISDPFNEAKTHQYLALLRAYQGFFPASFHHLEVAKSLFKRVNATDAESTLSAYQALCSQLAGDIQAAFQAAECAWKQAVLLQNERDMIRAQWILGNVLVRLGSQLDERDEQKITHLQQAATHLKDALERSQQSHTVDYEADLLLAWAKLHSARGNNAQAWTSATEALAIAHRSDFHLLSADIHMLLSRIALDTDDHMNAKIHAQSAFDNALCDNAPYWYKPTVMEAKYLLEEMK